MGGPQVMAEQPGQLAEVSGCRTCAAGGPVQRRGASWSDVGPVRHPPVPGQRNGRESELATAYKDALTGALYLDKPQEVERYAQAFGSHEELAREKRARSRSVTEFRGAVAPDPPSVLEQSLRYGPLEAPRTAFSVALVIFWRMRGEVQQPRAVAPDNDENDGGLRGLRADLEAVRTAMAMTTTQGTR